MSFFQGFAFKEITYDTFNSNYKLKLVNFRILGHTSA